MGDSVKIEMKYDDKYKVPAEKAEKFDILVVDNAQVRDGQIARLKEVRKNRDAAAVERTLAALTHSAETGEGNLLALSIEAARARAIERTGRGCRKREYRAWVLRLNRSRSQRSLSSNG